MTTEAYLWLAIAALWIAGVMPSLASINNDGRHGWADYFTASLWPFLVILAVPLWLRWQWKARRF